MDDCDKPKDPRRVAAGKKSAETREKKQMALILGAAAVGVMAAYGKCTLL